MDDKDIKTSKKHEQIKLYSDRRYISETLRHYKYRRIGQIFEIQFRVEPRTGPVTVRSVVSRCTRVCNGTKVSACSPLHAVQTVSWYIKLGTV